MLNKKVRLSTGEYNGFTITAEAKGEVARIEDKTLFIQLNPVITVAVSYVDLDGVLCDNCDTPIDLCSCEA